MTYMSRKWLIIGVAALALGFVTIHICADGGAMASRYRSCECLGVEWLLYDRTAADGPRRTLCLGLLQSRTCHQFINGPVVPCPAD
jgi:hypothetical protein